MGIFLFTLSRVLRGWLIYLLSLSHSPPLLFGPGYCVLSSAPLRFDKFHNVAEKDARADGRKEVSWEEALQDAYKA